MTLTGMNPLSVRYVSTVDLPESLVPMIAINILVDGSDIWIAAQKRV
jgi:hypothetical protein